MIVRLWHGWTTPANADAYERLLEEEIFRGIASRAIPGYRGIELLRRSAGGEVEFVTVIVNVPGCACCTSAGATPAVNVISDVWRAVVPTVTSLLALFGSLVFAPTVVAPKLVASTL